MSEVSARDQDAFFARVRAAFFAAVLRPAAPLVFAAFFAAVDLLAEVRLAALFFACADKARVDAAELPSRFSALVEARFRAVDVFAVAFLAVAFLVAAFFAGTFFTGAFLAADFLAVDFFAAARVSCAAFFFVALLAVLAGFAFTPARRALDSPIAIACFADRAPCLPSRTCSISS
ncbi:hypothetical protein KPL74_07685 [Bacillus sp. NP157]|nr:hypothetical protein KPL74_07685 [Bacillus sp. NP157]